MKLIALPILMISMSLPHLHTLTANPMNITTKEEHEAALEEMTKLIDLYPTDEAIPLADAMRLEELSDAIIAYEAIHYPMD